MEVFTFKPLDFKDMLIFGPYTPMFISVAAFVYMLAHGGTLKGLYGGLFFNLLVILVSHWLNITYNLNFDLLVLVIFEICLAIVWVMSITKITE